MSEIWSKVEILAPSRERGQLEEFLLAKDRGATRPFSEQRIRALAQFSQAILQDRSIGKDPSCVALAYWLRKAGIDKIQTKFESFAKLEEDVVLVPVGRVFHIAPANVDTLFVYSWALSFLCGNANLVRLSMKPSEIVQGLIRLLGERMEKEPALATDNLFVTYEHDAAISERLSAWCTHRIVWGGDETAKALRAVPLAPHASERVFASKFSYAVLSADGWIAASPEQRAKLACAFFNDAFWFDQMACSSPHALFWIGEKEQARKAMRSFDAALGEELQRRDHEAGAATATKRRSFAFALAANEQVKVDLRSGDFVSIERLEHGCATKEVCGGGVFQHAHAKSVADVAAFASERDQTVTHFGLSAEELRTLALEAGSRGVDRVVPIGEALAFDSNWDGFSLVQDFLRRVTVRS